jgi:hypothetical protein
MVQAVQCLQVDMLLCEVGVEMQTAAMHMCLAAPCSAHLIEFQHDSCWGSCLDLLSGETPMGC